MEKKVNFYNKNKSNSKIIWMITLRPKLTNWLPLSMAMVRLKHPVDPDEQHVTVTPLLKKVVMTKK